jgi:uncharacterized protein YndB with AHSA1/START domain
MTNRIEKSIELKAPVERVWRALTDHVEFGTWFRVRLDRPFVPGEMSRGALLYPGYEHVLWEARIVAMEHPSLFVFTWHPYAVEQGVDYSGEQPTRVEFHLAPTAAGTRLTVTESGFDALPAHRRDLAFRMNDGGWAAQMRNIEAHIGRDAEQGQDTKQGMKRGIAS